jgi:hypothetical protein
MTRITTCEEDTRVNLNRENGVPNQIVVLHKTGTNSV